jgi:hypothetical protein
MWVPIFQLWFSSGEEAKNGSNEMEMTEEGENRENSQHTQEKGLGSDIWLSALFLGSAMVARGEIGLLIIEVGYNETNYVSQEGFITGIWAILLNTILGPITVGLLAKFHSDKIANGKWGLQQQQTPDSQN